MQRAIVALGEALAHSVGSSEKRRLLAPTLAMGQVLAVTLSPFAGLCLCVLVHTVRCLSVERGRGVALGPGGNGWVWVERSTAKRCLVLVQTARRLVACHARPIWPFPRPWQ